MAPPRKAPGTSATAKAKPTAGKTPAAKAKPARRQASTRKAVEHLRASDPVLASIIDEVGKLPSGRAGRPDPDDHYGALVRSIVGQQLSVLAARAIYGRLLERFGGRPPTPQEILDDEPEELRAAVGLSRAKVGFLRSLAEHVLSGELELEGLDALPDEQVITELVAVKGLGEWTAHMFLMFQLERPDVLAVGDLGIRRAIEQAYGLPALPQAAEIEALAEPWRPYRTLACRYLWRSLQNEPG
jgi:DNA-3-methyladenine glycosylase II